MRVALLVLGAKRPPTARENTMRPGHIRWALGVVLTLALTAGCGGGNSPTAPTDPAGGGGGVPADVTIVINANQTFSPNPATVRVGQRVAWQNADVLAHTATADGGAFNTGNIAGGATSGVMTMTAAGSFPYHCTIHPAMVATITVTP